MKGDLMEMINRNNFSAMVKVNDKVKIIQVMAIIGLVALFCVGCSGGGSGSGSGIDSSVSSASVIEGVFVDSPVQGLDYMTETHSGITDEAGRFACFEGEMISFMIGDVMLGQAIAEEIMTPMDFLDESEMPYDVTHPMITNMGRFLQSLDSDGDPENGITIAPEVREEITGRMIDFHQSIEDFENDPDVEACFDVFNGLNMPHNGLMWDLFPVEEAREHMIEHMGQYMGDHMGFGSSNDSDSEFEHPMRNFTGDEMGEYMEEHMGFNPFDDPDGEFEHPMDEFMDDETLEYMNDHMGFGSSEEDEGEFEHPMEEFMDGEMGEYMEDHMGYNPSDDPDGEFEHPMNDYMDDEMVEYMNDHMGFDNSGYNSDGYSMGQNMGSHM